MRSLGQFMGHIAKGIKSGPEDRTIETKREVSTEQRDTPAGPVTLRRTVIEEISLPADRLVDAKNADRGDGTTTQPKENDR